MEEGHLASKKVSGGMTAWLCVWVKVRADLHMAQLMPLPLTHYLLLQLIQIGFTFQVLPFWCRLTRVVPDKIQEGRKTVVCGCGCSAIISSFLNHVVNIVSCSVYINVYMHGNLCISIAFCRHYIQVKYLPSLLCHIMEIVFTFV